MGIDKLKERSEGNLKAFEDAQANLRSMLGYASSEDKSVISKMAVQSVVNYLGLDIFVDQDCNSVRSAEKFFVKKGVPCMKYMLGGKEWWKKAAGPLLCQDKDNNLCALIPTALGYKYIDNASGKKIKVTSRNADSFDPLALSVTKPLPARKLTVNEFYKFLIGCVPVSNRIAILVFCTVATLLTMLYPVANKILFNEVIPSGMQREILPICALLLGAGLSSVLFGVCNSLILLRAKDKVNAIAQPALMSRLLYLPSNFFKQYSSGDLSQRVLTVNNAYQMLTSQVLTLFVAGVFSVMYIGIAFIYAKEMIWVVTSILIATIVVSYFEIKATIKEYNRKLPNLIKTQDFSQSAISGIQKIKNNRAEARVFSQWAKRYSHSEVLSSDSSFFFKYKKGFGTAILVLGPALAYFSAYFSNIGLSDYIAFMAAFGIMLNAIDFSRRTLETIARITPNIKLLEPILSEEPEIKTTLSDVNVITGSIDLNHVSFIYNTKSPKILDDVSLHIPAGQSVGLVGSSGCGKSTLMRIMMGFEKPSSGSVYYGQYNVADVNIAGLRQFVGYCPQNLQIFPGTIEDNIRMGHIEYPEAEVWAAAKAACIAEDIEQMPLRMQTVLGEGGSGLSGGQCQRLLIARALLTRPKVLFLDEATSALDNITQKGVSENISKMGCTRIMIAHRLSTVMTCDRILVLDKGRVIEDGTPQELLDKKGFFYQLSVRQL